VPPDAKRIDEFDIDHFGTLFLGHFNDAFGCIHFDASFRYLIFQAPVQRFGNTALAAFASICVNRRNPRASRPRSACASGPAIRDRISAVRAWARAVGDIVVAGTWVFWFSMAAWNDRV
jgi:hypothetical protein